MRPKLNPETVAAILADYAAGMSTIEVGHKYGVSDSTAHRYVSAAGIGRPRPTAKPCSVEECPSKHHARGYCEKHLRRFERYGDPLQGKGRDEIAAEHASRLEDARWMAETGEGLTGAAARLGLSANTLEAFLRRRNDPDCLARLIANEPRDHNRYVTGVPISDLTGLTAQLKRRRERQREVAA